MRNFMKRQFRHKQPTSELPAGNSLIVFLFVLSPEVKSVGKDDVPQDSLRVVVREVDRWVYLKIWSNIPGNSDCR